ncbi:MAG: carboxypeptidase regulatory-like domain-containing protein [Candidatus Acidiferrales bacterium]
MCLSRFSRAGLRRLAVLVVALACAILWAHATGSQQVNQSSQSNQNTATGQPLQSSPDDSAASISGHVYRADTGAPLGGMIVTLQASGADFGVRGASFAMETITAPDGSFQFTNLDPGTYVAWTRPGGLFKQGPTRSVTVAAGQNATNDIRLQSTGIISGTVTDQDGEPIEGMQVSVLRPATVLPRSIAQAGAATDDQGAFRVIGIPTGDWYVGANTTSIRSDIDSGATYYPNADTEANASLVKVTAGSETPGIRILVTVPRSGAQQGDSLQQSGAARGTISGHVTRSDTKAPVANAIVFLLQQVQMRPGGRPRIVPPRLTETGMDGAYEFDGLDAGDYSIEVHHPGFLKFPENGPTAPVSVFTRQVDGVDAQLKPAGIISGTLRDTNGAALVGMGLSLIPKDRPPTQMVPAQVMTDDEGGFRLKAPAPGSYYLLASIQGMTSPDLGYEPAYYPGSESLDRAQAIDVAPNQDAPALKFTLKRNPTFSVSVKVAAPGQPNSTYFTVGVRKLSDAAANAPSPPRFPALVAANGTVRLHGLSPGTYQVGINRVANVRMGPNGQPVGFGGGGPVAGSATIQINDSDVSVTVPISSFQ